VSVKHNLIYLLIIIIIIIIIIKHVKTPI